MASSTSTITSKGQATIPIEIRRALDLKPGDRLEFELDEKAVVVRKAQSWAERTAGILSAYRLDPPLTPREERERYMQGVADDEMAILRQTDNDQ